MTIRKQKRLLLVLGTVLILSAPMLVVWALWSPIHIESKTVNHSVKKQNHQESRPIPTLAQFKGLVEKTLRRPLYDLPPEIVKAPMKKVKRVPPLKINLLGTIIEPGNSMAMFGVGRGKVEMKGVGQIVGTQSSGPKIVSISPDLVVVSYYGKEITLTINQQKK